MSAYDKYQLVCGLEVHAQLSTASKMYSDDSAAFGGKPNSHLSTVTMGLPGALPVLNTKAIEFAVKMGIATNCDIRLRNEFARKNYFYADLPKGYQITQDTTPICTGGYVMIKLKDGSEKRINITRIHLEEDAGKSMHDQDPYNSLIDLNRAGVPLIEIVSEPDIRTSEEAYAYLTEIKKLVQYLDICDGNMEEGSLRCDANISAMIKGSDTFGERAEVKNMNSFRNVVRAIEGEFVRQVDMYEEGGSIEQQTRSYNAADNTTFMLRSKEHAHDYRYFPEPDIPPVVLTEEDIDLIKAAMPALPEELEAKYKALGLNDYDIEVITSEKSIALYFNELIEQTKNYKAAANWLIGPIKSHLNKLVIDIAEADIDSKKIIELIQLIDDGKTNFAMASQRIFPVMLEQKDKTALQIAEELNLIQDSDEDSLEQLIDEVLAAFPDKVAEYRAGKKGLQGMFMGQIMKKSNGKADPKLTNQLLAKKLNQ